MASKICRMNTIKAVFNKDQQRPTAYEIHQWLEENINVREDELDTLQLVSKQNAVYIKFNNQLSYEKHLQLHTGTSAIQLMNGATTVNITAGEFDTTTVRMLNVPPEVPNDRIMHVLQTYGKVQEIINEKWSKKFRFQVDTGIRLVNVQINKQIPSTLYIAGYEAYVVYPGQEQTCFLCGSASHIRRNCPGKGSRQIGNNYNRPLLMSDLLKPIRGLPEENHPSTVLPISEEATTSASSRTIEPNTREDGQDSDTITADEDESDTSNGQISKTYIEAKEPGKKRRKKNPELDQVKNDGQSTNIEKNKILGKSSQLDSHIKDDENQVKLTKGSSNQSNAITSIQESRMRMEGDNWSDEIEMEGKTLESEVDMNDSRAETHGSKKLTKVITKQRVHPYKSDESKSGTLHLRKADQY
ncbi:hypothetical protein ANN_03208 [Periplaneta americana]|uniref:CCHC-type domain-containing protein n=1 Tax=Periplaneta americana TaxID=6978 RepID=A0ABQ8TYD1_PERAM|nr:hypothetical protein ANN_03208 [Periplaneta americana]